MGKNCNCLLKGQTEVRFEGNINADIVFVLESPGETELIEGRPAVGAAGQRWEREINKVGINREHVFIINASRCRLNKKVLSDSNIKKILKSCRNALETTLHHINPKIIVACGGIAAHSVTGVPILGIKKRCGNFAYSEEFGCDVLYTLHPSATIRNEGDLPRYQKDMRLLRQYIDNAFTIPSEETNYREVDSIQFMLDKKDFTIGIDTETQGLRWFDPDHFVLISYSVSDKAGTGYNVVLWEEVLPVGDEIPQHHKYIVYERNKEEIPIFLRKADCHDRKMEELRELLTREDIKKYTKNGIGYDCQVLEGAGLPPMVNHAMDTQLASHTLDSELYLNNSLDFLMQSFTTMPAFKQAFSSTYDKADMLFSLRENRQAFTDYACGDADATLRVGMAIREKMIKDPITTNYYMKFVHKASASVLHGISKNGIKIDQARIQSAEVEVLEELVVCEHECIKRIPQTVKDRHEGNLNLNRRRLIADALFSEDGFALTATAFTAKTGEPQVSKDVLKQLKSRCNKNARDFLEWRENREELHTIYTHYIKSLQGFMTPDSKVHTSMSISFTSSGRAGCIRKGTKIEIARDIEKFPEGIPIENVEIGSWAYSFDDAGKPCMNKVIGKFKTGVKELIRVHWKNQPNSMQGYLDVTPEHEFRLSNGEYVQAIALEQNMSVCSLRRSLTYGVGRPRIFLTNSGRKEHMEHRFIYESIHKYSPEAVHHVDERILNNSPDNLEGKTVTQHTTYHNIHREHGKPTLIDTMSSLHALKLLAKAKGHPSKVPHDFTSYMKVLTYYNIDFNEVRKRYNTKGEFLGKDKIKKSLGMVMNDAIKYLGVRFEKWQYLIEFYGFERPRKWGNQFGAFTPRINNHLIDRIEFLNIKDEVWDLEIENTHNFVAGNLSVHNSRKPNTMVFPARNKKQAKIVKSLFVPPDGYKFLNLDLSQAELRFITHESQDTRMLEAFLNDEDLHAITGRDLVARSGKVWENLSSSEQKEARQNAKPVNFGLPYGMSVKGLRDYALNDYGIKLSQKEAKLMWDSWHNLYPGVRVWQDKCKEEMYRDGKVRTIMGRNRWLPNIYSNSERQKQDAERVGINVKIQGPSSDYTLLGGYYMYRDGLIDTDEIMLNNFVHDSLLFAIREDKVMEYAVILKQRMENVDTSDFGFKLSVPMRVDIQVGDNLADLKELEL